MSSTVRARARSSSAPDSTLTASGVRLHVALARLRGRDHDPVEDQQPEAKHDGRFAARDPEPAGGGREPGERRGHLVITVFQLAEREAAVGPRLDRALGGPDERDRHAGERCARRILDRADEPTRRLGGHGASRPQDENAGEPYPHPVPVQSSLPECPGVHARPRTFDRCRVGAPRGSSCNLSCLRETLRWVVRAPHSMYVRGWYVRVNALVVQGRRRGGAPVHAAPTKVGRRSSRERGRSRAAGEDPGERRLRRLASLA